VADTIKVLAQLSPAATTLTTLYTVPGATQTTVSSVTVCNQNATSITFRVSVAVAAAADNVKQYLYYDQTLAGNSTFIATIGMTLAATDLVRAYASTTGVSFNLFGVEVT